MVRARPVDVFAGLVATAALLALLFGYSAWHRAARSPGWLVPVGMLLAFVVAGACRRLDGVERGTEAPLLLFTASAVLFVALPDTELLIVAMATCAVATAVAPFLRRTVHPGGWWAPLLIGAAFGYVVVVQAAGRPASSLVAGVAVAPIIVAAWSDRGVLRATLWRAASGLVVGLLTARLTALGVAAAPAAAGSAVGASVVILLACRRS